MAPFVLTLNTNSNKPHIVLVYTCQRRVLGITEPNELNGSGQYQASQQEFENAHTTTLVSGTSVKRNGSFA